MPIKRVNESRPIQYRREVNALFKPQGLGILYSNNRQRTINQTINRFSQKIVSEEIGPSPEELRKESLFDKSQTGGLNYYEFKELVSDFMPKQYPQDIRDRITHFEYFNYIQSIRPLTKDEIQSKNGYLSSINNAINKLKKESMPKEPRKKIIESRASRLFFPR